MHTLRCELDVMHAVGVPMKGGAHGRRFRVGEIKPNMCGRRGGVRTVKSPTAVTKSKSNAIVIKLKQNAPKYRSRLLYSRWEEIGLIHLPLLMTIM